MNALRRFFVAIFYWTYPRGSWQWDLYCLAIIIIIFATPSDFLESYTRNAMSPEEIRKAVVNFFKNIR